MQTPLKMSGFLILVALAAGSPVAMAQTGTSAGSSLIYTQPLSPQGIREIQARLHQMGLYAGRIDGNWGADSEAALEHFQQTHGLQVTGQLNPATATTLNLNLATVLGLPNGLPGSNDQTQNDTQVNGQTQSMNVSRQAIQAVQKRLRQLNFNPGSVDGVWGADTQSALKQFQQGRALQPTGQLNPATLSALGLNPNALLMQNNQTPNQQ